jgi:hypothetical protein
MFPMHCGKLPRSDSGIKPVEPLGARCRELDVWRNAGATAAVEGGGAMDLQALSYQIGDAKFTGHWTDGSEGRSAAGILVAHEGDPARYT